MFFPSGDDLTERSDKLLPDRVGPDGQGDHPGCQGYCGKVGPNLCQTKCMCHIVDIVSRRDHFLWQNFYNRSWICGYCGNLRSNSCGKTFTTDVMQEEKGRDSIWGGRTSEGAAWVEIENGSDGRDVPQAWSTFAKKMILKKISKKEKKSLWELRSRMAQMDEMSRKAWTAFAKKMIIDYKGNVLYKKIAVECVQINKSSVIVNWNWE